MKMIILFLFALPVLVFASGHGSDYDITERVLNFLLFFSILYYYLKKPLSDMYHGRINSISGRLESIQEKLRASRNRKADAIRRVEEAKINAASLIETAKKEANLLVEKVKSDTQTELVNMERSFKEQKEFEERKITKSVVSEVLNDIFDNESLKVDQKELINIILKKVS